MTPATELLSYVRSQMLSWEPFYGSVAMNLWPVATSSIPTLCTDGSTLFYNPEYLASLNVRQQMYAVAHEGLHPALGHNWRIGSRDLQRANEAADFVVNAILDECPHFEAPPNTLHDSQYKGMSFEQVYSLREKQRQDEQKQEDESGEKATNGGECGSASSDGMEAGTGEENSAGGSIGETGGSSGGDSESPGEGTGDGQSDGTAGGNSSTAGGSPSEVPVGAEKLMPGCGTGSFVQAPPIPDGQEGQMTETDWSIAVDQAIKVAEAAGTMPGGAKAAINTALEPQIDWVSETREFLEHTIASESSWSTPNRRFAHSGLYLPGPRKDNLGTLVLVVDTSGSTMSILPYFKAEFEGLVREARPEKIYVVYVDAAVQHVDEYGPDDDIEFAPKGFGGTYFNPGLKWAAENDVTPAALIYLTDLMCGDKPEDPGCPVLWVAPDWCNWPAPDFGTVVKIPITR